MAALRTYLAACSTCGVHGLLQDCRDAGNRDILLQLTMLYMTKLWLQLAIALM